VVRPAEDKPTPGGRTPRLGELVRRALRKLPRSPDDLAAALQVSPQYVHDLIEGRRRPPLPGRTDVYDRMASFLRLGRHALETSALAERRAGGEPAPIESPEVVEALLALCEPETARALKKRGARDGGVELARVSQRLLDVVQGLVRRMLSDEIGVRIAAIGRGDSYVALRVTLLEFLDVTPETLTLAHLNEHITPRVHRWDVDLSSDVVHVVLRSHEPRDSGRRRPQARRAYHPRD
jgi:hypothetical protein